MLAEFNTVMPLVSVIIPNYNNANYLAAAIDSVLQQDYPKLEVIVVDDGSTDQSLEVLATFGNKIKVLTQHNQGPAAARNLGIDNARGSYISFLDSDDLWLQGKITAQVNFLESNADYIACFTSWNVWDGESELKIEKIDSEKLQLDRTGWLYIPLLKESVITTISILIRSTALKCTGYFDTYYKVGEDHDLWLRLAQQGKIAKLAAVFAIYRKNISSTTNKIHPHNYSLQVLEKNVGQFGLSDPDGHTLPRHTYQRYVAERHFTYGYQCFWGGERIKARDSFIGCIKNKNFLLKSIIYVAITSIPPIFKLVRHFKK